MTDSPAPIDPSRAALLVMDYQPGIVGRLPDPEAQLALMSDVIALAREKGVTVGYVRVVFTDDELMTQSRRRRATSSSARHVSGPSPPPTCTSS